MFSRVLDLQELQELTAAFEALKRKARQYPLMELDEFLMNPKDRYLEAVLNKRLAANSESRVKQLGRKSGEKWFKRKCRSAKPAVPSDDHWFYVTDVNFASQCIHLDTLSIRELETLCDAPRSKRIVDVFQGGDKAYNKTDAPLMMCVTKKVAAWDTKHHRLWSAAEKGLLQGVVFTRDDLDLVTEQEEFFHELVGNSFPGPLMLLFEMLIRIQEAKKLRRANPNYGRRAPSTQEPVSSEPVSPAPAAPDAPAGAPAPGQGETAEPVSSAPAAPDSPAGAPGDAPVGDQQDDVPYQPSPTKDNLDEDTQGALDLMADFGALLDL